MGVDLLRYIEYLHCNNGLSLEEIAEKSKESKRTVQRRIHDILIFYPNILREAKRDRVKVFRCTQPKAFVGVSLTASDVMMLHTLNMAVGALQAYGCASEADELAGFSTYLRRAMPRAAWKACERQLARLAECFNLKSANFLVQSGLTRRIKLAVVTERDAVFVLNNQRIIVGKPQKMLEGAYGPCLLVSAEDGEHLFPLAEIEAVGGVDDVLSKQFAR